MGAIHVGYEGKLDMRFLKEGEFTLLIPISPTSAELIGRIVVQWGGFEVRMNSVIAGMCTALQREPEEGWARRSFRRRKTIFRDLYREYLPTVGNANLVPKLDLLMIRAGALHWQRNVIAHGFYVYHGPDEPTEGVPTLEVTAFGEHKGRKVKIRITDDILARLFHAIAHLNGRLMTILVELGATFTHSEIVIDDRSILQDQPHGRFQTLPIPRRP